MGKQPAVPHRQENVRDCGIGSNTHLGSFKCTPDEFAELIEREGIIPAPYLARNKWVLLESLEALPAKELKRLIKDSYSMVAAKLPKKVQGELGLEKLSSREDGLDRQL